MYNGGTDREITKNKILYATNNGVNLTNKVHNEDILVKFFSTEEINAHLNTICSESENAALASARTLSASPTVVARPNNEHTGSIARQSLMDKKKKKAENDLSKQIKMVSI